MKNKKIIIIVILLILAVGIGVYLLFVHKPTSSTNTNSCINKTSSPGASGNCVSDLQTMINFMETDGLNQCPFTGSNQLAVSGSYDSATKAQVKVIQTWVNCYNKQENAGGNVPTDGNVDPSTWSALCTYAYIYPNQSQQSSSPVFKQSIAAGKDAGCQISQ